MYTIVTSKQFLHQANKLFKKHPELRQTFADVVDQLVNNTLNPVLKLHQLNGELSGLFSISLTYSYRIVLTIRVTKEEITLIDIGSHDEFY